MIQKSDARRMLFLNTLGFMICFACWTMYGVLVTFLVDHEVLVLDQSEMGWLIGIPVLTGAVLRVPAGILVDRFGGKRVWIGVLAFTSFAAFLTSFAHSYRDFLIGGLAFGVGGTSFAVGAAFTSMWFPRNRQGTALGLFGIGTIGATLTVYFGPKMLEIITDQGRSLEHWRYLPRIYSFLLLVTALAFLLFAIDKKVDGYYRKSWSQILEPLHNTRVWRFGAYYFLTFGGFVAISQWLVPYYMNSYGTSLQTAGLMAMLFTLPSTLMRVVGGYIADRYGSRKTLYFVFSAALAIFLFMSIPKMEATSPGEGVMAEREGVVTFVSKEKIVVDRMVYLLKQRDHEHLRSETNEMHILPHVQSWQEPLVRLGDKIERRQVIAQGTTQVYYQANRTVFSTMLVIAGLITGLGVAAVLRHIPEYFPADVGVVMGAVGAIGALGGFFMPVLFGYMLKASGVWTSCWLFLAMFTMVSLVWMHLTIVKGALVTDPLGERLPAA